MRFWPMRVCALHVATRKVNQPPLAVNEAEVLTSLADARGSVRPVNLGTRT